MHPRRAILQDLRAQVKTSGKFVGCWIQRVPPRNNYPAITLHAADEASENLTPHPSPVPQDRSLDVLIHGWVRGTSDDERAEQAMDEVAEGIEQIIHLPTGADTIELTGTSFTVDEEEPEIHRVTLGYRITYTTQESLTT